MRIFFMNEQRRPAAAAQIQLRRQKMLNEFEFERGLFIDLRGVGQRAGSALLFQFAQASARTASCPAWRWRRRNCAPRGGHRRPCSPATAASNCANCWVVCLRNNSTNSRRLSALPSVKSFRRSISTGGSSASGAAAAAATAAAGVLSAEASCATPAFNHVAHVLGADGLGQIIVHAGGEAFFPVALHGVRGHGDDDDAGLVIGMRRLLWRSRMARVASNPSISGIITSMKIKS